jgi:3-oxoacyl-[acyl-carrier protein] reductase
VVARRFAAEGARVAITYRSNRDAAEALAKEIDGIALPYDLGDDDSAAGAPQLVAERFGGLDVVVANAADVAGVPRGGPRFEDLPVEFWRDRLRANVEGVILTLQSAVRLMRPSGWGRIAVVSSNVVKDGFAGGEIYGAAKGALHGLARSLAWQVGGDGILVNVVSPGLTTTDFVTRFVPPPIVAHESERTPSGRLSTPEDVAATIVYLCSAANGNITGDVVHVAGGR